GALQVEDEEAGARRLALALLADPSWRTPERFALLREVVRLLPLQPDEASAAAVRHQALEIAQKDAKFMPLRAKIHNLPDAHDAEKVRAYAETGRPALASEYERLAASIDALYERAGAVATLETAAAQTSDPELSEKFQLAATKLATVRSPTERLDVAGRILEALREAFPNAATPEAGLDLLEASIALEDEFFVAANALQPKLPAATRRLRFAWVEDTLRALYGVGFLTRRELDGARGALKTLVTTSPLSVETYRNELRYLSRASEWSDRTLLFQLGTAEAKLAAVEPLVHLYRQDRLRGSPLLFYTLVTDSLVRDANQLAGIEHEVFGAKVGAGLRALNPGLARGRLYAKDSDEAPEEVDPDGIYLLPESTSDLPRVAGILTRGEGSSLSHVQLLARNLGIPNVVVGESVLPRLRAQNGQRIVLAVSPAGVVQIARDGRNWDAIFGEQRVVSDVVIRPDLQKLDLSRTSMIPLSQLRATDSGRVSGPKGANLGQLRSGFGEAVPDGFVIPFGVFRKVLDLPFEPGGPSTWDRMRQTYAALAQLPEGPARDREAFAFLARLRAWISRVEPGPEFRRELREHLDALGTDGTFGVFVRSDTNVEDLPGFTGAGLNLTVPNVVGFENVLTALREVWASPFTDRSYGWRQNHMEEPEYVFPAVVVQRSFPSEKSGVMVTADVDTGRMGWLSIAVNEGVGGAVDGQAAESLLVNADTRAVRLLAQATAPSKPVLSPRGGLVREPTSGTQQLLTPREIDQMIALSREVPRRVPTLRDAQGNPLPADIEFAFRDGRLTLLQIRPFVESKSA
ncbi:MAG TPA: PEP/pyruvate-binding domain-containing protein, partial [Myxococcota bacterium]|nr:PEP/pyruvate-binding domain-containing protein [Myxococcota bacterium]